LCWRVGDRDAVGEGYAPDDLRQLVFALRSLPDFVAAITNVNSISRTVYWLQTIETILQVVTGYYHDARVTGPAGTAAAGQRPRHPDPDVLVNEIRVD
jgi:hypothetical protein